jgi:hypothetical protein
VTAGRRATRGVLPTWARAGGPASSSPTSSGRTGQRPSGRLRPGLHDASARSRKSEREAWARSSWPRRWRTWSGRRWRSWEGRPHVPRIQRSLGDLPAEERPRLRRRVNEVFEAFPDRSAASIGGPMAHAVQPAMIRKPGEASPKRWCLHQPKVRDLFRKPRRLRRQPSSSWGRPASGRPRWRGALARA